eukprot:TRINITY_DN11117_c1_g1_i1.p1 TRINITY_DN11117_c1_g1~~TRINITY_DN11117_c1_g1_i1.p1  ORF type:complete len:299 (+),score=83.65 TRINITY_DN11117_c1_g1_i1:48-944(+)
MSEPTETAPFLNKWTEQSATYNRRDLLTYSLGIGCDEHQFIYEKNRKFAAFPTYPIVLGFKGDQQDVVNFPSKAMIKGPKKPPLKGIKVGLDGERYLEMVKPLPKKGGDVILKERLLGVFKKGTGASVEQETLVTDKNGDVYCRIVSGQFLVGAENFKDSGVSFSKKITVPSRAPDAIEEYKTTINQAVLYRLSGDYNPLHIDPKFAKSSGFKEPILHGLCSFGISCRLILKHYANSDPTLFKSIRVRFSKPVLPGQTLVVEMWKEGSTITFQTKVKETGVVCISNACLELKEPAAKL